MAGGLLGNCGDFICGGTYEAQAFVHNVVNSPWSEVMGTHSTGWFIRDLVTSESYFFGDRLTF